MSNFVAEQLQNASLVITHSVKTLFVPVDYPSLRLGYAVYKLVDGALAVPRRPEDYPTCGLGGPCTY